ncbi:hypothetical protein [Hungatella effluvii]|uniref:hypothetical protein n=1 Tax=Hungatella effluvii TaxID=1096246 RepID=UPI003D80CA6F
MRLVTRSDFDGLVCGALLKEAGVIDHWKFAHPKDLQDGLVEITEDDCLANVPFVEGCGLWFDHHSSEFERLELEGKYKGRAVWPLPVPGLSTNTTAEMSVSLILMR